MSPDLLSPLIRMISAMAIVLGAVLFAMVLLKRFMGGSKGIGDRSKIVRVIGCTYIAPRKSIILVDVAGEVLALGVTNQNITMLTKIEAEEALEMIRSTEERKKTGPNFLYYLERLLPKTYRFGKG